MTEEQMHQKELREREIRKEYEARKQEFNSQTAQLGKTLDKIGGTSKPAKVLVTIVKGVGEFIGTMLGF